MPVDISDVRSIVDAQEEWRGRHTINLIASENVQSPAVREIQSSDFMARYAEGHPNRGDEVLRYYQGTRYIDQVETMAHDELLALTKTPPGRRAPDLRQRGQHGDRAGLAARRRPDHRQLDGRGRAHLAQHDRRVWASHPEPRRLVVAGEREAHPAALLPPGRGHVPPRRAEEHRPDRARAAAADRAGQKPDPVPGAAEGAGAGLPVARHPGAVRRRARLRPDRRRAVPGPLARGRDLGHGEHAQDVPRPAARRHRLRPRRGGREALLALGGPRRLPRLVQQPPPAHAAGPADRDP